MFNQILTGRMITYHVVFCLLAGLLFGCNNNNRVVTPVDTPTAGTIRICADESFKPVIDAEIRVFESQHPNAKVIVLYKPEAECLRDLTNDSIRMVIVARGLTDKEREILTDTLKFSPVYGPLAFDAIAVIVNTQSKDTLFTMADMRSMVKGTSGYPYKVLLDGTSATSTVRYVVDSLLNGPITKNIVAAKNSEAVIDYVSNNNEAIGLLGVSWIGNKDDEAQLQFLKKIKVAQLECRGCKGIFVLPVQANIALGRYPMVRPLYYILKENYEGLGSGFKNFLIYERGQLIFKRAYLLPARMRFDVRDMKITQ